MKTEFRGKTIKPGMLVKYTHTDGINPFYFIITKIIKEFDITMLYGKRKDGETPKEAIEIYKDKKRTHQNSINSDNFNLIIYIIEPTKENIILAEL